MTTSNNSMTEQPQVQFNLSLDTVIAVETQYDMEGDYAGSTQVTLGDRIAEMVSRQIAQGLKSEVRQGYYKAVADKVDAITDEIVAERVRPVIDREFTPTDNFGNATGTPVTLAQMIADRADKWLTAPHKSGGYGDRKTNLQHAIDEAVGLAFKSEVQKAVKQAQDAAVAQVSKQAAEVFGEIIRKAARA